MSPQAHAIQKLETRFWQSMVDKDAETAMTMMAEDGVVAGPAGVMRIDPKTYGDMTREGQWSLKTFELEDVEVVFPTDEVAVIAYKVHQTGNMKGESMDLKCADTSTWVRHDGEWKVSAHTETILGHMPLKN
ncbi:MAG TPA: nuclear transport factor 2 family protein [Novosphingobium sp.]|nr:nuclear transport factor 2 family protein [Novosphingobium sp.]